MSESVPKAWTHSEPGEERVAWTRIERRGIYWAIETIEVAPGGSGHLSSSLWVSHDSAGSSWEFVDRIDHDGRRYGTSLDLHREAVSAFVRGLGPEA